MRADLKDTDSYLAEWRRAQPVACGDDLEAEADAAAQRDWKTTILTDRLRDAWCRRRRLKERDVRKLNRHGRKQIPVPMAVRSRSDHEPCKRQILDFVEGFTIETTPGSALKIPDYREHLRPGTTVSVTFLPGSDFADTIATAKRLKDEGFVPAAPLRRPFDPSSRAAFESYLEAPAGRGRDRARSSPWAAPSTTSARRVRQLHAAAGDRPLRQVRHQAHRRGGAPGRLARHLRHVALKPRP